MSNLIPRIEFAVQALLRQQRACPFCKGRNHDVAARKYGVVRIRHCMDCSLYFTDPIYRSYFGELYDSRYTAEGLTTAVPDRARLDHLKATNFSGSDKDCTQQIAALRRLRTDGTLLEIGSSWGYFLHQATTAGFSAMGVEPGRTRREFGVRELGADIRASMDALGDAQFDLIYSAHTLEHIVDAGAFLVDCHARLKDDGLLIIEVPHFDLERLGPGVLSIIGAVHPLGLSAPFFRCALPRVGFQTVNIFDQWSAVPSHPVDSLGEGALIAIAGKRQAPRRP